jgi:ribosome-associated protein
MTTAFAHITRHITRTAAPAAASQSESAAKRDVGKLVKAILDGLEDVKAQNIEVFDTEHLSSLFERVIVASGTSNRQTKALAASVRDAVRDAGFEKPRIEGEDNGEWIIVDCGPAVAHIMQPAIRQYYHLEDIWGEKPMRLKHAASEKVAAKKAVKAPVEPKKKEKAAVPGTKSSVSATKTIANGKKAVVKKAAKKVAAKKVAKPSPQAVAKKTAAKKAAAKTSDKTSAKKTAAKKSA